MEPYLHKQGFYSASGTVIQRRISPKGDMYLNLYLKGLGLLWATAPGSAKGKVRFGGGTEPLVWGKFNIYKGKDRFFLKSVEVHDDMWAIRKDRNALRLAARMVKHIKQNLPLDQPDDKLLAILYWNLWLITRGCVSEAVEWRFLWKWLTLWGLAPSLLYCTGCGRRLQKGYWCNDGIYCSDCNISQDCFVIEPEILHILLKTAKVSRSDFISLYSDLEINKCNIWLKATGKLLTILRTKS